MVHCVVTVLNFQNWLPFVHGTLSSHFCNKTAESLRLVVKLHLYTTAAYVRQDCAL